MTDSDQGGAHTAVLDGKHGPVLSLSTQRAHRHPRHIFCTPNRDMHDDPVIMPETGPRFRRVDKVDCRADTLLLDAERRDLEEARRIDAGHAALDRRSAP